MWCLTGNLDPRLVDGRAIDVAYDNGIKGENRTAEVTLNGEE